MHSRRKIFRKYSHSLGPDALQFLEEILASHDITDNDVEFSVETIAREYNKQDGDAFVKSFVLKLTLEKKTVADATMKVSPDILRRVYDALQDQGNAGEAEELLDPDSHLYFVDAFEMPLWHWSQERGTFEKCVRIIADSQLWTSFKSDHLALSLLRVAQIRE